MSLAFALSLTPEWVSSAECAGHPDPEVFFPTAGGSTYDAKVICSPCVVRGECLAYAMDLEARTAGRYGVYGGMSVTERARLNERGWTTDSPLPVMQIPGISAGRCPHCRKNCRNVGRHIAATHEVA